MPSDDLFAERRRKVDALRERGIDPYGVDFKPSATIEEARRLLTTYETEHPDAEVDAADRPVVTVAGRVMQLRDLGGAAFAHIEDESGRMQMWFRADRPGDAHALVAMLDLGDIVGITGPLTRTRRGEPSVLVDSITLLVKSLHSPPEKFHGLQDQETKYRKRYLDLLSDASQRRHFATRSRLVRALHATLDQRGFLEVETPILQPIPGGGAAVPFRTHWNALHTDVYLRIAIELHLKRLLVGGYARVYEIGRVFRNEGLSPRHNPEFTMLEAYQAYATYDDMRELTEALITAAANAAGPQVVEAEEGGSAPCEDPLLRTVFGQSLDLRPPYRAETMVHLVREQTGVDAIASWDDMHAAAAGIGVEVALNLGPGAVLLEIYEQRVREHALGPDVRPRLPGRGQPARSQTPRRSAVRRALRADHRGSRAGERVQRAQRPDRPARSIRGTGTAAERRRRRDSTDRRGLPRGDRSRHAAGGWPWHRGRPPRDVAHRRCDDPRRAAVPHHASAARRRHGDGVLMLPLQVIRDDPEAVRDGARRKGEAAPIDELLALDTEARALRTAVEQARAEQRAASATMRGAPTDEQRASLSVLKLQVQEGEARLGELDERVQTLLLEIPNVPHESVPDGGGPEDNVVARTWGEPQAFDFDPLPHYELGERLGIFDFERAAKISGSRFAILRGDGARLQRALTSFMLDVAREHGYSEVAPPYLVRREAMTGTAQLPKFEDEAYHTDDGLFLIPTAEVPVTNLYAGEILDAAQLPIAHVAFTPCWRREAGAAGKDTRGYIRLHQFEKVEMVRFTTPKSSLDELELITSHAEHVLQLLGLHYRVLLMCTGDLGFAQWKKYDVEVWAPGLRQWLEVSSCSVFADFQARRANIRYRPSAQEKPRFVHTLNGSALGVPRTYDAVLEANQQRDGSVVVPELLRPYLGGLERLAAS